MSGDRIHLFYIRSAFEYFFSTGLVDHLGLENVVFVMNEPREGIETRIADRFAKIYTKNGFWKRHFGTKIGKLNFLRRIRKELDLSGKRVSLYSPVYNETLIFGLRDRLERTCLDVEYFMIPDGAALLRHLPRKPEKRGRLLRFIESRYRVVPADRRHTSGSYSEFMKKVYHFPAKNIQADPERIEIVPVPTSDKRHNGEVLVIGALEGMSRAFVRAAHEQAGNATVRYRMHPRNRSGEDFIREEGFDWKELSIRGALEEHLLESPYRLMVGSYSTALMFNHLFVSDSESRFLIDEVSEDEDWRVTAESCGIPVIAIGRAARQG